MHKPSGPKRDCYARGLGFEFPLLFSNYNNNYAYFPFYYLSYTYQFLSFFNEQF